jgi:succinate dehydrogenase/fumarate reductase flavoprotein subunit
VEPHADGHVNVRAFGGMKIERTWFAADKTGFHMLHTLFQTSIKYPSIRRFDEHFCSTCRSTTAAAGRVGDRDRHRATSR